MTNFNFDQVERSSTLTFELLRKLCDLMAEPRHLPARIVPVNDVALRCAHQLGLGVRHRLERRVTVAALDRLLDGANGAAHLGAARLVDHGAAGNLAGRLLGGSGIGHRLEFLAGVACVLLADRRVACLKGVVDAAGVSERSCACRLPEPICSKASATPKETAAAGLPPPPSAPL